MVLRILGEVLLGFLAAGIVMAIAVPAALQFGYEPGPWVAWSAVATSVAVSVVVGERLNRRRQTREAS